MKSEWRVMSNPIGDEMRYGVYRLYDKQKVMHSGNMEIAGYYDHKEDAEKEAARRNAEEKEMDELDRRYDGLSESQFYLKAGYDELLDAAELAQMKAREL